MINNTPLKVFDRILPTEVIEWPVTYAGKHRLVENKSWYMFLNRKHDKRDVKQHPLKSIRSNTPNGPTKSLVREQAFHCHLKILSVVLCITLRPVVRYLRCDGHRRAAADACRVWWGQFSVLTK